MKRRQFNLALGGSLVALQLALVTGCKGEAPLASVELAPDHPDARRALDQLSESLSGIDFVGPVCDRRLGEADPLGALLQRLDPADGNLIPAVQARMARDFQAGELLDIDGWKLSVSECLLLAGAARLQGLSEPRLTEASGFSDAEFIQIERWGPDATIEGEIFNPIGNGRGGFWLRVNGDVNGSMRLELDGVELATHFELGVITASLEPEYMDEVIHRPGAYELALLDKSRRLRQTVGVLTVAERPPPAILDDGTESTVFCQLGQWGPDVAVEGEAFNRQPDGAAGFWVHVGCAPRSAVLELDGVVLRTTVRPGLVTARVEHFAELGRGEHPLVLVDPVSGERLKVGDLTIQ
ncbi:hypothetical protein [Wenzhouxiangella marina]|uniref:Uncharacterized protein n=1 Tax=Wenzhouxiangella marina TaxID=1579979 RepID=A0A0K0XZU2_9GAMM|nr:hypothetical protein [Wenzhouxiangella marina]AKS43167.1 hypothetical protein WM2015_2810 [Wenzhouxiangella marina]MBB6087148.1 hypothetical protein [Wenzhouxiangella marina]